jgi:ribonuclease HI
MYYAVASGRTVGIFSTWNECKISIQRYPRALYKKFATEKEAKEWLTLPHSAIKRLAVYTDGSVIKNKAGAGVCIENIGWSVNVPASSTEKATISRVEAYAVLLALCVLKHTHEPDTPIEIFIDSDYCRLTIVKKYEARHHIDIFQRIWQILPHINVIFSSVDAHKGIKGNERADMLAKRGCSQTEPLYRHVF